MVYNFTMGRKISKKTITDAVMELNPTELSQIVNKYNKTHGASIKTENTLKDEMLRLRKDIDVKNIKEKKYLTKKVHTRYTKTLIMWPVNVRTKSNNLYVKLDEK